MAQKPALTDLQNRMIHTMRREEERAVRIPKQRECGAITVREQDMMESAAGGSARRAIVRGIR